MDEALKDKALAPPGTPIEIRFQDEARVGQKNGLLYQWARNGTRPRQPKDQRYDNAYLFGAICPARDICAAVVMPYADTHAMQTHLDEISRHVAAGAHAVPAGSGRLAHDEETPRTGQTLRCCPCRRNHRN